MLIVMKETRRVGGVEYPIGTCADVSEAVAASLVPQFAEYVLRPSDPAISVDLVSAAAVQRNTYYLGLFGDSEINRAFYSDADSPDGATPNAYFVPGAKNNAARAWSFPSWLFPNSMGRVQVLASWARQTNGVLTPGTTPPGFSLEKQITQALADRRWQKINRVVIMIGKNDSAYSIPVWAAELLRQIRRIDRPVDLIAPFPRSDAVASAAGGDGMNGWAWFIQAGQVMKRIADESGGRVRFITNYGAVNTPGTIPDGWAANNSDDTIHGNNVPHFKMADAYIASLFPSGLSGDLDIWPHNSHAGSSGANGLLDQGFSNPCLSTGTGGTAGAGVTLGAGQIASGLTLTGIGTGTVATPTTAATTIPGGIGNMQTIPITSGAAGDGVDITTSSFHAAGGTFLRAGDLAFGQCLLRVNSGGIYPRNMFYRLNGFASPDNYNAVLFELDATKENALPMGGTRTFLLRTPLLLVPAGISFSNLVLKSRITFAGAGACTVDIGNIECRRIRAGVLYS